jgi:hypothetical protein
MTTSWHGPQHEPISWEMFLDIDEDIRRDLEIVDGYGVPREQRSREHQKVATRLSLALETAAVQQMRKTGGAECYETNTGVDVLLWEVPPKVGAVTIERHALAGGTGRYVHVGTSHRDMGPTALRISDPFPVEVLWADLEVAPRL